MNQEVLENSSFYQKLTRITKKILLLKPDNPHLHLFESVSIMPEKLELEEEDTIDQDKLTSLSVYHKIQSLIFRSSEVQAYLGDQIFRELVNENQHSVNCIRMKFIIKIYFDVKKIVKYLDEEFDALYDQIFTLPSTKSSKKKSNSDKPTKSKKKMKENFSMIQFKIIFERIIFFAEFFIVLEETYSLKLDITFLEFVEVLIEYLSKLTSNKKFLAELKAVDFGEEVETNYSVANIEKKSIFKLLCQKVISFFKV